MMLLDVYELAAKSMIGEQLSDEEKNRLREYNARYALVRFLYMEKMNREGSGVRDFHFTPGDGFFETPILDVVNDLMKIHQAIKDGKVQPLNFGDSHWVDNPPSTGRTKTTL